MKAKPKLVKKCLRCEAEISGHFNVKYCLACKKIRRKEIQKKYDLSRFYERKENREKRKDEISSYQKSYYNKNKERLSEYSRHRYQGKRDKYIADAAKYRKDHPEPKRVKNICVKCGKEFFTARRKANFCSPKCVGKDRKNNKPLTCAWCGKEFYVSKSQQKYRNRKCCSRKCGARYNAQFRKGENNNWWRGGVSSENRKQRYSALAEEWRKSVFERDDYTCQNCKSRGSYLQAHHIKPWARHPELRFDINNGKTLCKPCHKSEHDRIGWR